MFNRIVRASRVAAGTSNNNSNNRPSALAVFARDTADGCVTTVRHTFMILGVTAIGAMALMFVRPDVTDHLKALSPFTLANAQDRVPAAPALADAGVTAAGDNAVAYVAPNNTVTKAGDSLLGTTTGDKAGAPTPRQQVLVTNWLSKKYRVAGDATDMLVSAAYTTAKDMKLDPLLILSVMAIESGFNPFAESPVGAQGLMQVMSKLHHEKFQPMGGIKAALNPVANIRVGSLILKDYVKRGGSVEAGLKMYVGAAAFDTDFGYGSKVLAEYRRLQDVAMGKNVPVSAAYVAKAKPAERAAPVVAPAPVETPTTTQVDPIAENRPDVASL